MEKEEEKDDPTTDTAPQANPGIFMRLKSNILNRLQNAKIYSCPNLVVAKMEELISRPFVGQI